MAMGPISGRSGRRRAPMSEINVTPLVDVMLVLLIIFMVAAPLLVTGVPVNLPSSRAGALDDEKEPIQISIERSGAIYIDKEVVANDQFAARLMTIAGDIHGGKPRQIFLRADRGLAYGQVMRVMGELNRAGLNRVALVTTGEEGRP